ncbi:MAG: GNAT family N-acetyltransferase [Pseudomonadota bacterium]
MLPDRLNTVNLTLRPFAAGDGAAVFQYWGSDPGWARFNASVPSNFTEADANSFVAELRSRSRADQPHWALVYHGDVVGVVSLTFDEARETATVGYGIHGALKGRGLCAEAVAAIVDLAFTTYPELKRINARTDSRNRPSQRVLEKLGFSRASARGIDLRGDRQGPHEALFCLARSG